MTSDASEHPREAVQDLLHDETQVVGETVHLSLAEVAEVVEPGRLDFGGGEMEEARTRPVPTSKRNPGDDYAWWTLPEGTYVVEWNESLQAPSGPFRLEPRPALLERGAFHPSLTVRALPRVPLHVGGGGIKLKENARVSVLRPVDG